MHQGLVAAGLGGLERVDHLAQFTVAAGQHLECAVGGLPIQFAGSVLRGLYGFLQARGDPGETVGQAHNRFFGLLARTFHLLGPDRHGAQQHLIELCPRGHAVLRHVGVRLIRQRPSGRTLHRVTLGTRAPGAGTQADQHQPRADRQIGRGG